MIDMMSDFYRVGNGMSGGADHKLPMWELPRDANRARDEILRIFMLKSRN